MVEGGMCWHWNWLAVQQHSETQMQLDWAQTQTSRVLVAGLIPVVERALRQGDVVQVQVPVLLLVASSPAPRIP
jgi:hypothetical protein